MRTVGAYEAKTHLSQLLDEVAHGESITITRHGTPVARLVPTTSPRDSLDGATTTPDLRDAAAALDEWREYRRQHNITLGGISIRELIEEGRRS